LLLRVKLDVVTLTYFPMDMILEILPGENYSDIRALADLSVYVKYTNRVCMSVLDGYSPEAPGRSWRGRSGGSLRLGTIDPEA
jgi:hypothetical protein